MKTLLLTATLSSILTAQTARTFTGVITDSMCGKNHAMMKITPDSKCIRECVKTAPTKYALYDGVKVYVLSDQSSPAPLAGQKVKVKGTLFEKTQIIKVESIEAVK